MGGEAPTSTWMCNNTHTVWLTRKAPLSFSIQIFYWSFVMQAGLIESLPTQSPAPFPIPEIRLASRGLKPQPYNHIIGPSGLANPVT